MKDKEYYIAQYNNKWNECLSESNSDVDEAMDAFNECANDEEVVGYYIVYHQEDALRDWKDNTDGKQMTEQDLEVDKMLKQLFF